MVGVSDDLVMSGPIPLSSLHEQSGSTALYMASQNGHVSVVELLLQKYADVSICTKVWTVHYFASFWPRTEKILHVNQTYNSLHSMYA